MRSRPLFTLALALVGGALAAAPARATISPIAPFYGEQFESFEDQFLGFYPTGGAPYPIFGGKGGMTALTGGAVGIANLVSDTRGFEVTARNGNLFAGTPIGALRINFADPRGAFGTYIANAGFLVLDPLVNPTTTGVAEFYANGESLGTQPLSITVGNWAWYGWTSTTPFDAIEIRIGDVPQGAPYESVLVDALVADASSSPAIVAPEPASASLVGLAAVALRRRRR